VAGLLAHHHPAVELASIGPHRAFRLLALQQERSGDRPPEPEAVLARKVEQLCAMTAQGVRLAENCPEPHAAVKERVRQRVDVIDAPGMLDRLVTERARLVDPAPDSLAECEVDEVLRPQLL